MKIIIDAAIIILLVPCWSLGQSQDNIQKTLTNESPRVSVENNALICNSLNSPSTVRLLYLSLEMGYLGEIYFREIGEDGTGELTRMFVDSECRR